MPSGLPAPLEEFEIIRIGSLVRGRIGQIRARTLHLFLERYEVACDVEMRSFVTAVSSGHFPAPSIRDGLQTKLLSDAAIKPPETGQPLAH